MIRNLGRIDQFIRIIAGFAIFAYLFKDGAIGPAWPVLLPIVLILLVTAFFSFCPLYAVFGWNTSRKSRRAS